MDKLLIITAIIVAVIGIAAILASRTNIEINIKKSECETKTVALVVTGGGNTYSKDMGNK